MKKFINKTILVAIALLMLNSCYEQDLQPVTEEDFPLQILLDLNEGGAYESDDDFGLNVSFDGGVDEITDQNGEVITGSPGGTRGPASTDLVVEFVIENLEGLTLGTDVTIDEVIYEIDDCTEGSADFTFNNDGTGTFTIPAGVEEVEIVFALDDSAIDNDIENTEDKGFELTLTGIQGSPAGVLLNINNVFEYTVLDDEAVFNEWTLDHEDADLLNDFISTFSPVLEELEGLTSSEIDEIIFEYGYSEVKILVVLTETEMVEECAETDEVNLELEIEGEFEVEDGEIEMVLENADGDEFTYSGTFLVTQGPLMLSLTLEGEDEDGELVASEVTLILADD